MSGNLRHEMKELAVHAQNVGVEASARIAAMMREFANGIAAMCASGSYGDVRVCDAIVGFAIAHILLRFLRIKLLRCPWPHRTRQVALYLTL